MLCASFVFAIALWSNLALTPIVEPDTEGLLSAIQGLAGTRWAHAVVLTQMALLAAVAVMGFGLFRRASVGPFRASVAAVLCSITPG